jgi:two-component system phosphate regulon sensor histidine kinase PhoR
VEFVRRIEEQSDRLHELILDLLQLARVESGQEVFEITSVFVESVVDGCLESYSATAAAKQITLAVDPRSPPVWVSADEEGLRTIISNLIDNAIKYTPQGGRVTVRWDTDGQEGWCEVQDTGIGIPKAHHARIFERFYRVDKARSRELGGTGLGLSIVKHLAQAFGGGVRVESQPRAGSTFRVTLPLAEGTELAPDRPFTESSRILHNPTLQDSRVVRGSE